MNFQICTGTNCVGLCVCVCVCVMGLSVLFPLIEKGKIGRSDELNIEKRIFADYWIYFSQCIGLFFNTAREIF